MMINLNVTYDDVKKMSKEERQALSKECEYYMDHGEFGKYYDVYDLIYTVNRDEYKEENEMDFIHFYNEHIKGHSKEELQLGNKIAYAAREVYRNLPKEETENIYYIFDDSLLGVYAATYWESHRNYFIQDLLNALKFSLAFESYSDWHKDVYGFRPRLI